MPKILECKNWPCLAIAATIGLMVLELRLQGRIWFCKCGELLFWTSEPDGPHTSQHLADPYTFTHVLHGFIFLWVVQWLFKRWKWPWQLWLMLTIEAVWEVIENTDWVIDRYRNATAAIGYTGDSVLNSVADVLACWLGIVIARRAGWRITAILFVATEVALLVTIRDNLSLNVIQLFFPSEALKQWQMSE